MGLSRNTLWRPNVTDNLPEFILATYMSDDEAESMGYFPWRADPLGRQWLRLASASWQPKPSGPGGIKGVPPGSLRVRAEDNCDVFDDDDVSDLPIITGGTGGPILFEECEASGAFGDDHDV